CKESQQQVSHRKYMKLHGHLSGTTVVDPGLTAAAIFNRAGMMSRRARLCLMPFYGQLARMFQLKALLPTQRRMQPSGWHSRMVSQHGCHTLLSVSQQIMSTWNFPGERANGMSPGLWGIPAP